MMFPLNIDDDDAVSAWVDEMNARWGIQRDALGDWSKYKGNHRFKDIRVTSMNLRGYNGWNPKYRSWLDGFFPDGVNFLGRACHGFINEGSMAFGTLVPSNVRSGTSSKTPGIDRYYDWLTTESLMSHVFLNRGWNEMRLVNKAGKELQFYFAHPFAHHQEVISALIMARTPFESEGGLSFLESWLALVDKGFHPDLSYHLALVFRKDVSFLLGRGGAHLPFNPSPHIRKMKCKSSGVLDIKDTYAVRGSYEAPNSYFETIEPWEDFIIKHISPSYKDKIDTVIPSSFPINGSRYREPPRRTPDGEQQHPVFSDPILRNMAWLDTITPGKIAEINTRYLFDVR